MTHSIIERIRLREKGQMTVPPSIRAALNVEPGDELEFEVAPSGQIMVRGLKMIPAEQAWFWTESWQRGEIEASEDIAAGRVETFKDSDSFLDSLR
jgi:antitoxin PrlF